MHVTRASASSQGRWYAPRVGSPASDTSIHTEEAAELSEPLTAKENRGARRLLMGEGRCSTATLGAVDSTIHAARVGLRLRCPAWSRTQNRMVYLSIKKMGEGGQGGQGYMCVCATGRGGREGGGRRRGGTRRV